MNELFFISHIKKKKCSKWKFNVSKKWNLVYNSDEIEYKLVTLYLAP